MVELCLDNVKGAKHSTFYRKKKRRSLSANNVCRAEGAVSYFSNLGFFQTLVVVLRCIQMQVARVFAQCSARCKMAGDVFACLFCFTLFVAAWTGNAIAGCFLCVFSCFGQLACVLR